MKNPTAVTLSKVEFSEFSNEQIEHIRSAFEAALVELPETKGCDVKLLKPELMGLTPGEVIEYVLIFSSPPAIWFTKKWADTYLWPQIEKRIGSQSKELMKKLNNSFDRRDS